jgi:hypothetical protein
MGDLRQEGGLSLGSVDLEFVHRVIDGAHPVARPDERACTRMGELYV